MESTEKILVCTELSKKPFLSGICDIILFGAKSSFFRETEYRYSLAKK